MAPPTVNLPQQLWITRDASGLYLVNRLPRWDHADRMFTSCAGSDWQPLDDGFVDIPMNSAVRVGRHESKATLFGPEESEILDGA